MFESVDIGLRGSVSLSRYGELLFAEGNVAIAPQRKPTRIPSLTQALTRQPVSVEASGSAAPERQTAPRAAA